MTNDTATRLQAVTDLAYDGRSPLARTLYPLYLTALLGTIYGVTVSHALFALVSRHQSALGFVQTNGMWLAVVVVVAGVLGALALGRLRGPVLPDFGYLDLVVSADAPRSTALRPWWRASLFVAAAVGGLSGLVIGGGMAITTVAPITAVLAGLIAGLALGVLLAWVALVSQSSASPDGSSRRRPLYVRESALLDRISLKTLRTQAALNHTVTAALFAGETRHIRREVHLGRPRAREARLAPWGAVRTILAADLLALRRAPWGAGLGALATVVGVPLVVWALSTGNSWPLAVLLPLLVLGTNPWLRGLRSLGDNAGSSAVFGAPTIGRVSLHLVPAATLVAVLWCTAGWFFSVQWGFGLATLAATLLTMLGSQVYGAFRGRAPSEAFLVGEMAAMILAMWIARPVLIPALVGLGTAWLTSLGHGQLFVLCGLSLVPACLALDALYKR